MTAYSYTMNMSDNFQVSASMIEQIYAVRNAFLSCSFTRTSQSGTVGLCSVDDLSDTSKILGHSSSQQLVTTDIFAFGDSWQATNPLYIKVSYVVGAKNWHLRTDWSMGSVHNGSGSLTGVDTLTIIGQSQDSANDASVPTSGTTVWAGGDGSAIALMTFPQHGGSNFYGVASWVVFERFYDSNGQPTGSGFHMIGVPCGTFNGVAVTRTVRSQASLYGTAPATQEVGAGCVPNARPSSVPALYDGRLVLGLIYPMAGVPQNPSPNILLGNTTDLSIAYQTFPYTVYGTTRTYRNVSNRYDDSTTGPRVSNIYTDGRWALRAD